MNHRMVKGKLKRAIDALVRVNEVSCEMPSWYFEENEWDDGTKYSYDEIVKNAIGYEIKKEVE